MCPEIVATTRHSSTTVSAYTKCCRNTVSSLIIKNEHQRIGGDQVIVEIDESKFARCKYHDGKGCCVLESLVGLNKQLLRVFLEIVPDRPAATLLAIIGKYLGSGSITHTDMWKVPNATERALGLQHYTVNHKNHLCN